MNDNMSILCDIKCLAECMNDCNWQDMSDRIINAVNKLLADYAVAKHYAAECPKPKSRRLKFFRSWLDANGKKHFCIDQYDNVTNTAVSPRDHFFG